MNITKVSYKEILDLDFDGVEVFYPYVDRDYSDVFMTAKSKNLMITGGSDFHGPNIRNTMGLSCLDGDYALKFLNALNIKSTK